MSEIIKLVKDAKYRATVTGVTPRGGGYAGSGSNNGKWYNCHFLVVVVDQFPSELFNLQICDLNHDFNLLEVGDYFSFIASTYKLAEDRYTVKFESKIFKQQMGQKKDSSIGDVDDKPIKQTTERVYQSSVAGTPWSICLTAAKDFHKDRKLSKDEDVIKTLKAYLRSYNEYMDNEKEYLK